MLLYRLVCQIEVCCEQTFGTEKICCNNTGYYFLVSPVNVVLFSNTVNHCVRKPAREFVLSNGSNSIAKSLSRRITSVKQCAATSTVLLLYTPDLS